MKTRRYYFLLLIAAAVMTACSKDDDVPGPVPGDPKQRTFFLYIAADNSLGASKFDYENIASLVGAVRPGHLQEANIVIYHDPKVAANGRSDVSPRLLEVVTDAAGRGALKEVIVYPEQNSGSAEVFRQMLTEAVRLYPAQRYSLLMWSHGSGWLPGDYLGGGYSRAIAQDNRGGTNSWIEIDEFAAAIPDGQFDCILFDACNMAYAEVAYPLRTKTKYIIGSTIEIMGNGMNYERMPDLLLPAEANYTAFCDAFYETYNTPPDNYGCTISLLATEGLDALAASVKEILKNVDVRRDVIGAIPTGELQPFGRALTGVDYSVAFFDLAQYMELLRAPEAQITAFRNAMGRVVAYNRYSDQFRVNGIGFAITHHSGLGCYIPRELPKLNAFYDTLAWCKGVYPGTLDN
jgi:hypothetical protein